MSDLCCLISHRAHVHIFDLDVALDLLFRTHIEGTLPDEWCQSGCLDPARPISGYYSRVDHRLKYQPCLPPDVVPPWP